MHIYCNSDLRQQLQRFTQFGEGIATYAYEQDSNAREYSTNAQKDTHVQGSLQRLEGTALISYILEYAYIYAWASYGQELIQVYTNPISCS